MPFKSLKLNQTILQALADEGYEKPTPIQAKAIPPILEGRDVLGCAQTGTGKTAAFALPMIQRLSEAPVDKAHRGPKHPRARIHPSPTRASSPAQIGESFATYGRHAGLSHTVIYGGVSQFHQVKAIHRGVDVLVATPGRLMDLMEQRIVTLKEVGIFVLDEADRMLDMGFIQPIRRIASQLPRPRQTLLFSATMPKEIMHLADSLLHDPVKVSVTPVSSAAPLIEQRLYMVQMRQKMALLEYILDDAAVQRVLVFTKTKHGADRVCKNLNHDGVPAVAIHGNKAQNYRTRALDGFKSGKTRVLVATDVAARGLDVDDITHVVNFDLPMEPEAYVHRIGRTGRAGATGIAIPFCDSQERDLLRAIQRLTGKQIPVEQLPAGMPTNDHASAGHGHDRGHDRGSSRGNERGPARERSSYGNRPAFAPRGQHPSSQSGYGSRPPRPAATGAATLAHFACGCLPSAPHPPPPTPSPTSAGHGHAPRTNHQQGHASGQPHSRGSHAPAHRGGPAPHAPATHTGHAPAGHANGHVSQSGQGKKPHRKGSGPNTKPSRPGPGGGGHGNGVVVPKRKLFSHNAPRGPRRG